MSRHNCLWRRFGRTRKSATLGKGCWTSLGWIVAQRDSGRNTLRHSVILAQLGRNEEYAQDKIYGEPNKFELLERPIRKKF